MGTYYSSKTYGHEQGLSAVFRQWRATSHCNQLHGYALSIQVVFGSQTLDDRNWVVDFGSLKPLKQQLVDTFDHKLIVSEDDPYIDELCALGGLGLADPLVLPAVGCEAFAEHVHAMAESFLRDYAPDRPIWVDRVVIQEHGANGAEYHGQ